MKYEGCWIMGWIKLSVLCRSKSGERVGVGDESILRVGV